jgi:hypothetical protein
MPSSPMPFMGWEPPKYDINASSWLNRLRALNTTEHRNKWAKYGPYKTRKSSNQAISSIRRQASGQPFRVDTVENQGEDGEWYIHVKVREEAEWRTDASQDS